MAEPSLRGLLQAETGQARPVKCTTCLLLRDLTGDDRKALQEALGSEDVSSKTIARALTGFGVRISGSAVSRHRRECKPLD